MAPHERGCSRLHLLGFPCERNLIALRCGAVMPHAADQLLLQLLAIFVSAKVAGELFERVWLPSVLGQILSGIALGPFALGWINPSDTIQSVADIGAIFVLFSAGARNQPERSDPGGTEGAADGGRWSRRAIRFGIRSHEVARGRNQRRDFRGRGHGCHQCRNHGASPGRLAHTGDARGQDHPGRSRLG